MTTATDVISSTNNRHIERRDKCLDAARRCNFLTVLILLVFIFADIPIFYPFVQSLQWETSVLFNNVAVVICSAIPILLSFGIAKCCSMLRTNILNPVAFVGIIVYLIVGIIFFIWVFTVRSEGADSPLIAALNTASVVIAIVSLGAHLWLSKKHDLFMIKARIHDGRISHNNNLRALAPLKQTSSTDYSRRRHDFQDWMAQFKLLPEVVKLNMDLSRTCCAERKGSCPEDHALAASLPYNFNNQTYTSGKEAQEALAEYLLLPEAGEFHVVYGAETNPTLDRRTREAIEDFQNRYEDIVRHYDGVED